jgi:hypothetical protein
MGTLPSATLPEDHPAPGARRTCGTYGWYAPDDAGILSANVFGAIEASGRILMGERSRRRPISGENHFAWTLR